MNNTTNAVPQLKSLQPNGIMWIGWMANGDGGCVAATTTILVSLPFSVVCFFFSISGQVVVVVFFCAFFHYLSLYCPKTCTHTHHFCLFICCTSSTRPFFVFFLSFFPLFFPLFSLEFFMRRIFALSLFSHWITTNMHIHSLCSWAKILGLPHEHENTPERQREKEWKKMHEKLSSLPLFRVYFLLLRLLQTTSCYILLSSSAWFTFGVYFHNYNFSSALFFFFLSSLAVRFDFTVSLQHECRLVRYYFLVFSFFFVCCFLLLFCLFVCVCMDVWMDVCEVWMLLKRYDANEMRLFQQANRIPLRLFAHGISYFICVNASGKTQREKKKY